MRRTLAAASVLFSATLTACEDGDFPDEDAATDEDAPIADEATTEGTDRAPVEDVDVAPEGVDEGNPEPSLSPAGLTVQGEGRVTGEPDVLRITIGVEHFDPDADTAVSAMSADTDAVIEALLAEGVAEEDLQTAQLSIRPEHDRERADDVPQTEGYRAVNTVEASIRDLDEIGSVLDAAIDAGGDATHVQGVTFALEDNEELLERARQEAVAEARRRAEQYADAAGVALGELESVTETGADRPQPVDGVAMEAPEAEAAPPVQPGEEEVGVTVQMRWSLAEDEG